MMRIPNPWERARNTDGDGEIGSDTSNQDCVVCVLVINENQDDTEDQPCKTGRGAAAVDTSEMLIMKSC